MRKSAITEKVCRRLDCHLSGQAQPIENFSINKGVGDGYKARCKACVNRLYSIKRGRVGVREDVYNYTMSSLHQRQIFNNVSRQLNGNV